MYEDPKSKISQLEKVLDAREDRVSGKVKRHELHDRDIPANQDWDQSEFEVGEEVFVSSKEKKKTLGPMKILIGSIIFFVLAILVVAFKFIWGGNLVSGNNIDITVKAPISVSGGEIVPFEIEIKNNNNVTLAGADLGVTFPIGAKDATNTSLPAKRAQIFLGDILPGQSLKKNLSVALFGTENEKKEISILLEYKVSGSNSLFNKTKIVSILISSAPVSLVITRPSEVNTNQSVDFTMEVTSNSPTVIKNLLLKADYPFGFSFRTSDPKTFSKDNLWLIGDLEPGAKRVIKFSGVLNGQEGEERGFNFNIGSQSKSDSLSIDSIFSSSFSSITIRRPFVSADIFIDGIDSAEYVSPSGSKVDAIIKWQNNLPYEVNDVSIIVKINGNAVNKSSIQADGGYYRSIDNSIIFNKTTNKQFTSLEPGISGESKFTFSSFGSGTVTGSALTNPTITLAVSVSGKRVDYNSGNDDILFSDSKKIKLTSNPELFAKALYYVGPFKNTGPMPAKAEQETTYTITWTVTNPSNNLTGAHVSAVLPPYIKWLGAVSPTLEKVSYDASTGTVVWNIGNILAGAGTIVPAKEVSFQISFLASVDQIGTSPNLVGEATLVGKDNFTLTTVSDSFSFLTTRLSSDPYFKVDDEDVVQ
jgi:hypothetical protein